MQVSLFTVMRISIIWQGKYITLAFLAEISFIFCPLKINGVFGWDKSAGSLKVQLGHVITLPI